MDIIINDMKELYHKNIESYAKKHKIEVNIPISIVSEQTNEIYTNTETETILTDDYVYKKPWNKLNSIHKIIKIKEFINNIMIDDIEMKKLLKNQLVNMIKNKKLTKKSDIEYDHINGKIISIPSLQFKNNKYNIIDA